MRPSARTGRVRARAARPAVKRPRVDLCARVDGIVASLPDALWSAELPGKRLTYVSPGAGEVFGCAPAELLARRNLPMGLVHADDRAAVVRAWSSLPASGNFDLEYRIVAADGGTRWIHDRARVVRDPAGVARRIDGLARDVTQQMERRQLEQFNGPALYDALTKLPNRTLFRDRLTQALEAERRGGTRLALMVFDIERFKSVNDAYGQHSGDRLLQQVASSLRAAIGDVNRVARLSGDVFAVVFPALQDAGNMAVQLRAQAAGMFREPFLVEGRELHLTLKAGIAIFPEDGDDADTLFRNAEAALKRARETGERHLFYAPEINARVSERMDLEQDLRKAIERHEFVLHFQPKIDLHSGRIVGLEALLRWPRPGKGLVAPDIIIPVLEQTGMILEVGRQVMVEAVATHRRWLERGLRAPRIAVNVSTVQLRQPDFCETVREAIAGSGPCGLDLEVTESLMMHNLEDAICKLREVQALGVGVSLDDFGTGYSSLARLARLPVDTLKIDRVFINRMTESPDDTSIVTAILSLGRSLNRTVIAEGVETEAQARLLRLLRCDQMQGELYSAPLPIERLEPLLFN